MQLYISKAVIVTEVIVHVASDGRTDADPVPKTISIELIREDGSTVVLTQKPVTLDCSENNLRASVMHDLSKPFYRSRGETLLYVRSAKGLRKWAMNPVRET